MNRISVIQAAGLAALLLVSTGSLRAQESGDIVDMVTDRPDQTESASIVPSGKIQTEIGVVLTADQVGDVRTVTALFPTMLLRVGVTRLFEIRLAGDVENRSIIRDDETLSGDIQLSNVALGLKSKLAEESGAMPELALLAHLTLPIGPDAPEGVGFGDIRLAAAHTITDQFSLGYNIGAEASDDPNESLRGIYTVAFGVGLGNGAGSFVELYGDAPWEDGAAHSFDAGFTYTPAPRVQVDLSGGFGISEAAEDFLLNVGISLLFL